MASINGVHENSVYLPGVKLPDGIKAHADFDTALKGARLVVNVVPSHCVREVFARARDFIEAGAVIASASKGIEGETLKSPSGVTRRSSRRRLRYSSALGPLLRQGGQRQASDGRHGRLQIRHGGGVRPEGIFEPVLPGLYEHGYRRGGARRGAKERNSDSLGHLRRAEARG